MRRGAVAAATAALCIALAVGATGSAVADDASPTPAPTASTTPTPTPSPTTPTTPPVTPTAPATTPTPPPIRRVLPLKKGHRGHLVDVAQQRLEWLGYSISPESRKAKLFGETTRNAVKKFQTKFWRTPTGIIDRPTWNLLRNMSGPVGKLPKACTERTSICADKTAKILRYVVDGKVKLTLDARFGLPGMETGDGYFTVNRKSRDHVSSLYHTWMPFALFFNGGEAVHYSPFFARDGYNGGSHGCIGVRDIKMAAWLFDRVPIGTRVYVYYS